MNPIEAKPSEPRVLPLISAHLDLMRSFSPSCSVHALEADALDRPDVRFFAIFEGDVAVAMGALKVIGPSHGELKSMHVRSDFRGIGLADAILSRLLEEARAIGLKRVSLETGSQEAFAAARAFYGRSGFTTCGPFEGYGPDQDSFFMTKAL